LSIISALLIVSISINVLFFYKNRVWKYEFYTKLAENDFYESEDVFVQIERKHNKLDLLVSSEQLNFQLVHDLKEEDNSKEVVEDQPNNKSKN